MARPVRDDMARNQMTTEMAEDRGHWHVMIRAGTLRIVEADRCEGEKLCKLARLVWNPMKTNYLRFFFIIK